ncbi:DNA polymerase [Caulobacter phage Kuura]|nr:DNA polymerase [Caulobacter phage Kuura]
MAIIIQSATADLRFDGDPNMRLWAYNGLDCVATRQIVDALRPSVEAHAAISYNFVRAMQAPALDMMLRGIMVNPVVRRQTAQLLIAERDALQLKLDALTNAVWGRGLNVNSPKQLLAFFYGALNMPVQYALRKTPQGKKRTPSTDHKALEALAKMEVKGPGISAYDRKWSKVQYAQPFVSLITAIRDRGKKLAVVNSGIDRDGRFRCSYNVAGTVTGRWSSSKNVLNGGSNLQNITEVMRRMFCADDGMKLAAPDLEQAESRMVAGLVWQCTGDDTYWRACESGDLHTIVCTMAYPEKFVGIGGWDFDKGAFVGDLKACRAIADEPHYRHLSLRDLAKRIGHGSNYYGPPFGIAMMIGIPVKVVTEFQRRYFRAFPAIPKWHAHVIRTLQTEGKLVTPVERQRIFFGRLYEDSTLREAIANIPQSTIGELLNLMLYKVWEEGIRDPAFRRSVQLLLQVHDSIVFQYPDRGNAYEDATIARVEKLMSVALPLTRTADDGTLEVRNLHLPLEFKTGWNWSRNDPKKELFPDGNPDGLRKYAPGTDIRKRLQSAKPTLSEWLD